VTELEHGKAGTYNNRGCRCEMCKAAWAEYLRPRQQARRRAKGVPERGPRSAPSGGREVESLSEPWTVRVPERVRQLVKVKALKDRVTEAAWVRRAITQAAEMD
jgi:hypothetical protein